MTVSGLDVSHFQGQIDWTKVAAAGDAFAWCKTSEGTGYVDPDWLANLHGATAAGILVGGYHYAKPASNPEDEAHRFLTALGPAAGTGYLPPVLDLEETGGLPAIAVRAWAVRFLAAMDQATTVRTWLYSGDAFYQSNGLDQLGRTAWIARYGHKPKTAHWTVWQSSSSGHVPGVPGGAVDLDQFPGTLADLRALAGITPTPEDDVPLTDDDVAKVRAALLPDLAKIWHGDQPAPGVVDGHPDNLQALGQRLRAIEAKLGIG